MATKNRDLTRIHSKLGELQNAIAKVAREEDLTPEQNNQLADAVHKLNWAEVHLNRSGMVFGVRVVDENTCHVDILEYNAALQ